MYFDDSLMMHANYKQKMKEKKNNSENMIIFGQFSFQQNRTMTFFICHFDQICSGRLQKTVLKIKIT